MSAARLPQNVTAERAALSLLHHSPECLRTLPWRAEMFHHPGHLTIFTALERAVEAGRGTDLVAMTSALEGDGSLESVGGAGELTAILYTYGVGNPPLAREYFDQLNKAAIARQTLCKAREHLGELAGMTIAPERFVEIISEAAVRPAFDAGVSLRDQLAELRTELSQTEPPEVFPFGLLELDAELEGGLHRGEMGVVAGETSRGKSVLLIMAARHSVERKRAVVFFSLEMPAKDILRRLASNFARQQVKARFHHPGSWAQDVVDVALDRLEDMPLTIVDHLSTIEDICAEAQRLARLGRADVIIVDYLQLVENSTADNREQAVSEVTRKLKNLALTTRAVVFTASQLNEDGRLRESRAIGHHADQVISIADKGLLITKNRRGPCGRTVAATLEGEISRFH